VVFIEKYPKCLHGGYFIMDGMGFTIVEKLTSNYFQDTGFYAMINILGKRVTTLLPGPSLMVKSIIGQVPFLNLTSGTILYA